ncbi:MAG: amidase family protein [Oscillospiraceae bacterium]|nr:amidase family protein [Oscillospiraceae bacterium]
MKTIGIRNNICIKNEKTTCGSKMLENFISPYNSTVVEKLNEAKIETQVINMKEFRIEEDEYIAEFFAKGTANTAILVDGNGEIAKKTTNGLIGLKPTFGLVSRFGVITNAPSLEQVRNHK